MSKELNERGPALAVYESQKKLDSRDIFQVDILGPAYHSEFGHVKNS